MFYVLKCVRDFSKVSVDGGRQAPVWRNRQELWNGIKQCSAVDGGNSNACFSQLKQKEKPTNYTALLLTVFSDKELKSELLPFTKPCFQTQRLLVFNCLDQLNVCFIGLNTH